MCDPLQARNSLSQQQCEHGDIFIVQPTPDPVSAMPQPCSCCYSCLSSVEPNQEHSGLHRAHAARFLVVACTWATLLVIQMSCTSTRQDVRPKGTWEHVMSSTHLRA